MGVLAWRPLTRIEPVSRASAVEAMAARTLNAYLRGVGRRGTLRSLDADGRVLDGEGITRALAAHDEGRPRLVVYWGADAVAVASLPYCEAAFLAGARGLTFLFDQTFGGRVCAELVEELGSHSVMLARSGDPERLEQLRRIMRRSDSYAFAVDGGGPYFQVGNGVASLARTLKALIIPLAAIACPALPWVHRSRISFPLPGCQTTVAIGRPIDGRARDRHGLVTALQDALQALGRRVRSRPECG